MNEAGCYLWSVAHAFTRLEVREIETSEGPVNWAGALVAEVVGLERPDGSWVNRFTHAKEDDPLVATPRAAAAPAVSRRVLTGPPSSESARPHD